MDRRAVGLSFHGGKPLELFRQSVQFRQLSRFIVKWMRMRATFEERPAASRFVQTWSKEPLLRRSCTPPAPSMLTQRTSAGTSRESAVRRHCHAEEALFRIFHELPKAAVPSRQRNGSPPSKTTILVPRA